MVMHMELAFGSHGMNSLKDKHVLIIQGVREQVAPALEGLGIAMPMNLSFVGDAEILREIAIRGEALV